MTTAVIIYAGLCLIPFLFVGSAVIHSNDLTWLERELERRIAEEEVEDEPANDNWSPS